LKKYIQISISVLIVSGIYYLFIDDIRTLSIDISVSEVVFGIVLMFVSILPRIMRWQLLMNYRSNNKVSFLFSAKITFVGLALNIISPAGSGDIIKSYYGYKWLGMKERMLSVSFYDKLMAFLGLGFLSLLALGIELRVVYLVSTLLCVAPFLIVKSKKIVTYFCSSKIITWLNSKSVKLDFMSLQNHMAFDGRVTVGSFLLSLLAWVIDFIFLYYCFSIVGLNIPLKEVFFDGSLLKLGKLFPFTINGLGTDELIMTYLFAKSEFQYGMVVVSSLIYRVVMDAVPAIVGVIAIFVLSKNRKQNKKTKIENEADE
jgi:uncharacterized protein (TIRG00374 family)